MTKPEGAGQGAFQEWVGEQAALVHDALKQVPESDESQVALAGLANQAIETRGELRAAQDKSMRLGAELSAARAENARLQAELRAARLESAALRTELRKAKEDSLESEVTGLPNKRALQRQRLWSAQSGVVPEEMDFKRAEDQRRPWGWACVYIDLDHFKPVNDMYGHDQGDRVLMYVAQALLRTIRETDELYHPSGDEFIVFSQIANKKQAIDMTASIHGRFKEQLAAIQEGKMREELPEHLAVLSTIDHEALGSIDATFGVHWNEGAYVDRNAMYERADREMREQKRLRGLR